MMPSAIRRTEEAKKAEEKAKKAEEKARKKAEEKAKKEAKKAKKAEKAKEEAEEEERYGSDFISDDVMDYRTAPPFRLILSPTATAPTKADMEIVRKAMEKSLLRSLRDEAKSDEVSVQVVLGDVVELKFVAGEERDGQLRRRLMTPQTSRQTRQQPGYTEVGFDESWVAYTASLLSDFTPPSQTKFEKKTFAAVVDDAVDKLPMEIHTIIAETGKTSGALSGVTRSAADLSYVLPPIEERTNELVVVQKDPPAVQQPAVEEKPAEKNMEPKPAQKEENQEVAVATNTSEDETPPVLISGTYTGDKAVVAARSRPKAETVQISAESGSGSGSTNTGAIAGSLIAVLAVTILAVLVLVKRRKAKTRSTKEGDGDGSSSQDRTVELADERKLVNDEPFYRGRNDLNGDDERNTNLGILGISCSPFSCGESFFK